MSDLGDRLFVLRPVRLAQLLQDTLSNAWAARENGGFLSMQRQGVPSLARGGGKKEIRRSSEADLFGCVLTLHGNLCQTWKKPLHDLIMFSGCCWHSIHAKVHVNVPADRAALKTHTHCFSLCCISALRMFVAVIISMHSHKDACV